MLTQEFDLKIIPDSGPVVVHVNQYDTGIGRFVIHLLDVDETPYSPTNATVMIQGTKPDKHGFAYTATISGSTVTADVTEQMTAVEGIVRTQIIVTDAQGVTGTFVFHMDVQRSALQDDTDISETELPAIIDLARKNAREAAESAAAAKVSEDNAKDSEDAAATSEANAAESEENAATSETNAKISETNSADSASAAATSEANAATSETNAAASEANAATSETNAAASEANAAQSETNAKTSETNAAKSESAAAKSEVNAKASETNAAASESNAAISESNAEAWAVGERGGQAVPSTDPTYRNNSKFYAESAEDSEDNAFASEQRAKASEQAAKASEEILQYYVDFVIPRFIIQNNRLYISTAAEGEFIVANNRLYIKNAS